MTYQNNRKILQRHDATKPISMSDGGSAEARLARLQQTIRTNESYRSVEARERFLDRVHDIMEAQGISRAELARRLGKSRAYVTHLLGGERNFSFEVAAEISHALGQTFCPDLKPEMSEVVPLDVFNAPLTVEQPVVAQVAR